MPDSQHNFVFFKSSEVIFMDGKRLFSTVAVVFCGLGVSFSLSNCGREVSAVLPQFNVSTACRSTTSVSKEELFRIIGRAHSFSGSQGQRVRCPGFFALIDEAQANGSLTPAGGAAVLVNMNPALRERLISEANDCNQGGPPNPLPSSSPLPSPVQQKDSIIRNLLDKTDSQRILGWIRSMSDRSLWDTRYHDSSDPRNAPQWILDEFRKIAGRRPDIRIRFFEHKNTLQPSVEAVIEGSGPNREKFVVLGGHEDSIHERTSKVNPDSFAPGADDNASGVAVVLETFRVIVESGLKPDASLVFYAYAAEEVGLVGSQEIAQSYANAGREVLGVMQLDMSSYSLGVPDEVMFVTDYTSNPLTQTAALLAQQFVGLKVSYDECGYACSDHASWNKYNYHAILPAEKDVWTSVSRIHTEKDIVDSRLHADYAEKFAKLAIAFGVTLGF
jgi:hypothetical protein